MRKLKQGLVLLFYDTPQVFLAKDEVGAQYVCMIGAEDGKHGPEYACTPLSPRRAKDLVAGKIDLRSVYEFPEIPEFMSAHFFGSDDITLETAIANYTTFPRKSLPETDLYFEGFDEVAETAAEMSTTVSFVSLEVPEAKAHARIHTNTLGEFLFIFQAMVRNFSRVAARLAKKPLKKSDDSYAADVFGFARGSFTIKFCSSHPSDMHGEHPAFTSAMEQINTFLNLSGNSKSALEYLQSVRGHTASSLIKLLNFLSEHEAAIRVEWANPSMTSASRSELDLPEIRRLVEICRQRSDLSVQEVVIRGRLDLAAQTAGTWKLISEEDKEVYSGEIAPGSTVSLNGAVIGDAVYEFFCEETVEVVAATGRENRRLFLKTMKKLSSDVNDESLK